MRRKLIWALGALALIAAPAVIGLAYLGGDDNSARRSAALIDGGKGSSGGYQLVVENLTPPGKAVDVISYAWGVTANATLVSGSGLTAGKAQFSDLQITKKVDQTSALFVKGASTGQQYPKATLRLFRDTGGGVVEYMAYEMEDVLISVVQHGGSSDDVPTENVSIAFSTIQITAANPTEGLQNGPESTYMWKSAQKVG